ncbi:MAG: glycosyltransferase family 2 protein [Pseudooceanicola nanhaiensis]
MPDAAIIIPHYNDLVRLERCLSDLVPQIEAAMARGQSLEAMVVDNDSTVDLGPLRARFPAIRFVTEPLKGAANARNRGVEETDAEMLFFIDSDCVPAPDWVETAFAVADRADLVGGTVTVFDESPPPRSGAEAFETVFAFDFRAYIEEKGFSGSGNLVTWRRVFDRIGGFRHGMSEDLDWSHRATAAGFSLVHADELRVAHPTRTDWTALERKWRRLCQEGWGLQDGGGAARLKWAFRALLMLPSVALHTPKVLRHPALAPGEKAAALATLARLRLRRCGWMLQQAAGREI